MQGEAAAGPGGPNDDGCRLSASTTASLEVASSLPSVVGFATSASSATVSEAEGASGGGEHVTEVVTVASEVTEMQSGPTAVRRLVGCGGGAAHTAGRRTRRRSTKITIICLHRRCGSGEHVLEDGTSARMLLPVL